MRSQETEIVRSVAEAAIPGASVVSKIFRRLEFSEEYGVDNKIRNAGFFRKQTRLFIWWNIDDDYTILFEVLRNGFSFSSREKKFISFIPDVLEHLKPDISKNAFEIEAQQIQRLATRSILATTVVAKFIHNKRGSGFSNPASLLSSLQELCSQNYEGSVATSGFLIVPKVDELRGDKFSAEYQYLDFANKIRLRDDFFESPISYRYIDGRNAFYVIDRASDICGIIRLRNPLHWSLVDRMFGKHIQPIISNAKSKSWAIIVGNNRDIQIVTALGPELRWNRNRWQYIHIENIVNYISDFTADGQIARQIFSIAWCLSLMRVGALILVPQSQERPKIISDSVGTEAQAEISATVEGMSIEEFTNGAGMFGVFGSDGLTIVGKDGIVESAGKIVALSDSEQSISGGGRTQAAIAVSKFGLAIKVSEDGPISLFLGGKQVIKTNG